jgi:hypothetical protein
MGSGEMDPVRVGKAGDVEMVLSKRIHFRKTNPNSPWPINGFGFEAAGVEFIDENGGGPGVRLRKALKQTR